MMKPTIRTVLIFASGIPLTLIAVIFNPDLWPLSAIYGGLVLVVAATDLLLAPLPRMLDVSTSAPDKLYIGEHGAIVAEMAVPRYRRSLDLQLLAEQHGDVERSEIVSAKIPAGEKARVELPVVPLRRGRVRADRIWIRWRGPLGLVEFTRIIGLDRTIDVLPNVRGVHGAILQFYMQEAMYGMKTQLQKGEGAEFDALREYMPGLDRRFIDWKHSARHRKLLCKEFRAERNHQVIMAFDTGYLMLEPVDGLTRLDHAINAGLVLARVSLQGGDLVGTYGFDSAVRQYIGPGRGISSLARMERATAELAYSHQETNFTLGLAELSIRLKRRALVILFTDFVDTITAELMIESMQRVANRHLVVFVTQRGSVLQNAVDAAPNRFADVAQAVIAQDFLRERSIVLERLQRLGVHCIDVPSRSLPIALINRYLMIKQRGLI
jgi:uncharacterized protein (DUF58 family)